MNLHNDIERFKEIIELAEAALPHFSVAKIEKDYYLTLFLKTLTKIQTGIIFKGGTSLSKCHKVIDRFSEDIDLNFTTPEGSPTRQQKQDFVNNIKSVIDQLNLQLSNPERIRVTNEVNQYIIKYQRNFEDRGIKQYVIAETVVHIKSFPTETKEISCIIHDYLIENGGNSEITEYGLQPFNIEVQAMERTFIDKVYALADYAISGETTDHSRHIYDLYKIYPKITFNDDFKELVAEVVKVRKPLKYSHSLKAGVDLHKVLQNIIDDRVFAFDYDNITASLIYTSVPYSEAIKVISQVILDGCFAC